MSGHSALIVMMQAIKDRQGNNLAVSWWRLQWGGSGRDALIDALVEPSMIVIRDVRADLLEQMAFAEDQQEVQALPA